MTEELIKRLEAATGPCRELDKGIARAIGFFDGTRSSYDLQLNLIPHFSASIDAALTLVPEGYFPTIDFAQNKCFIRDKRGFDHEPPAYCINAATPALAIVIAALRALRSGA